MTKEDAAKAILKKLGIVHTKKKEQSVVKIIEQFYDYEDEASIENARMRDEVNNAIKALELIKQEADDALDVLQ
jgi:hypothetical protein